MKVKCWYRMPLEVKEGFLFPAVLFHESLFDSGSLECEILYSWSDIAKADGVLPSPGLGVAYLDFLVLSERLSVCVKSST